MGEEYGEHGAVPVLHRPHRRARSPRPRATGAGEEFAALRAVRRARSPIRRIRRPSQRSKLTRRRDGSAGRPVRASCWPSARGSAGESEPIEFDEDGRWLRVRRGSHELVCNFAHAEPRCRRRRGRRRRARHRRRRPSGASGSLDTCPACRSADRDERDGLAGPAVPARRHLGRGAARTSRSSPRTPSASSCACSTTRATRRASR